MSRGSTEYAEAAAAPEIQTAWLVAIPALPEINNPTATIEFFFTDWPEQIMFDGDTYLPSPMQVQMPKISKDMEKSSGSIALCNLTNVFTGYAKAYRIRDTQLVVIHAVKTESGWVGTTSFVGVMDAPTITETQISVNVSNGRSVATLIPRLLYWSRDFPHIPSSKDPRELATK